LALICGHDSGGTGKLRMRFSMPQMLLLAAAAIIGLALIASAMPG
jgi:hypothetical protein